jgi:hypothetical protein
MPSPFRHYLIRMLKVASLVVTLVFMSHHAHSQGAADSHCKIEVSDCPKFPGSANKITQEPLYDGSPASQSVCMNRGYEVADWCGTTHDRVKTMAYHNGVKLGEWSTLDSSCQITTGPCPAQKAREYNTFFDLQDKLANRDRGACMQRATAYAAWCNTTQPVAASYYERGRLVETRSTKPSHCKVDLNLCPLQPAYSHRKLIDFDWASQSDEALCLRRSTDFQNWCGSKEAVTTAFVANGVEKSYKTTGTECFIETKSCPQSPSFANRVVRDLRQYSNSDQATCQQRSKDYYNWCGLTEGEVKSTFVKDDRTVKQTVYGSKCVIETGLCPGDPNRSHQIFEDVWANAGKSADNCAKRVKEYFNLCFMNRIFHDTNKTGERLGADQVRGKFYLNGSAVSKIEFGRTCNIQITRCPGRPKWENSIFNVYDNFNSEVTTVDHPQFCMNALQFRYARFCGPNAGPMTATYMLNGRVVDQRTIASQR